MAENKKHSIEDVLSKYAAESEENAAYVETGNTGRVRNKSTDSEQIENKAA